MLFARSEEKSVWWKESHWLHLPGTDSMLRQFQFHINQQDAFVHRDEGFPAEDSFLISSRLTNKLSEHILIITSLKLPSGFSQIVFDTAITKNTDEEFNQSVWKFIKSEAKRLGFLVAKHKGRAGDG